MCRHYYFAKKYLTYDSPLSIVVCQYPRDVCLLNDLMAPLVGIM